MEKLSRDPNAFIRPSPSGGTLGGVARKTREAMLVFEAAGFDVVLVETIGVGQSEITVRSMVDFFMLLTITGAGDELQGMKKGVFELADALIVNKADGANLEAAERARADYERTLHYLLPATEGWETKAFTSSALRGEGIDQVWQAVEEFRTATMKSGGFDSRRKEQTRDWLHSMLEEQVRNAFYQAPSVQAVLKATEERVMSGELPATQAAWELLTVYARSLSDSVDSNR
jgi:LAO/AO transport system kinase